VRQLLVLCIALLAVAGCTRVEDPAGSRFVDELRDWSNVVEYVTFVDLMEDDELIEIGRTTCEALDSASVDSFYEAGDAMQFTLEEQAALLVGSVTFLCAEHEQKVAEWHGR
jgi:hypothetical protein